MTKIIKFTIATLVAGCFSITAVALDTNFNGFASAGGAFKDSENGDTAFYQLDKDIRFDLDTRFALQANTTVNDKTNVIIQLLAEGRGSKDFEVGAEWAYISYEATSDINLRVGRMKAPFYNYSDYLDVGYAYHWVRPPTEVYRLGFDTYDGIEFRGTAIFGDIDASLQVYYGRVTHEGPFEFPETQLTGSTGEHLAGIVGSANWEWLNLRASYHRANLTTSTADLDAAIAGLLGAPAGTFPWPTPARQEVLDRLNTFKDETEFYEIALTADFEQFFVQTEITLLDFSDTVFGDTNGSYLTGGYRIDDFTLHATFGLLYFDIHEEIAKDFPEYAFPIGQIEAGFDRRDESITVGVRWDFTPAADLKFEVQQLERTPRNSETNDTMIYSFVVDTVF